MTVIRQFADIGKEIARNWGLVDKPDLLKSIDAQTEVKSLLCALVSQMGEVLMELERLDQRGSDVKPDEPSDGMLLALTNYHEDFVSKIDFRREDLSVRAKKAIFRSGVRRISNLTEESLCTVKNCGRSTISEIMEWKASRAIQQSEQ